MDYPRQKVFMKLESQKEFNNKEAGPVCFDVLDVVVITPEVIDEECIGSKIRVKTVNEWIYVKATPVRILELMQDAYMKLNK